MWACDAGKKSSHGLAVLSSSMMSNSGIEKYWQLVT